MRKGDFDNSHFFASIDCGSRRLARFGRDVPDASDLAGQSGEYRPNNVTVDVRKPEVAPLESVREPPVVDAE
jgi:hypothetical protein